MGSVNAALAAAFNHFDRNLFNNPAMFRDVHVPDVEARQYSPAREEFLEFCADDFHVAANKIIAEARERAGSDWPVIELAYSHDQTIRYAAIQRIKQIVSDYPSNYLAAVCLGWRSTAHIKPSLLLHLSGEERGTESEWRATIIEKLNAELDRVTKALSSATKNP